MNRLAEAGATIAAAHRCAPDAAWRALHRAACERYRDAGRFAWHFARGKLGRDPVFRALLERGEVAPSSRLLDIGCGQGLLASLLGAVDAQPREGWPLEWPAAPTHVRYSGIELMARDVARATRACAGMPNPPHLQCADMCSAPFPPSDVVVILDALHYVAADAQQAVLARVRDALAPAGRLLLRVGDASDARGFVASQWVDRAVTRLRGHRVSPTFGRPLGQWIVLLERLGFVVRSVPMSRGTPFANVLLIGDLSPLTLPSPPAGERERVRA